MNKILSIILIAALGGSSVYFWQEAKANKASFDAEVEKSKIKITKQTFSDVVKLTFLEIKTDFVYFYDREFKEGLNDKISVLYEWDYTFSYGFDLGQKNNWNWCAKVIDGDKGIVQVNAPNIVLISSNPPSPQPKKTFKKASYKKNVEKAAAEILKVAIEKNKDVAKAHLSNASTKASIQNALASHLQDIMNSAHKDSNPISKVNVVFSSVCK
ncbi:MAG: hypothetical protein OQK58_05430 [Gammaproteobacteria bacterium]|nr:hypothetical protein [Gammaproteobacteria bacterium]